MDSWSQIRGLSHFVLEKQRSFDKRFFCSVPVFSKNQKYAFLFIEIKYSGQIRVYKKTKGDSWTFFCRGLVWIE
jgi:hypothetical protein